MTDRSSLLRRWLALFVPSDRQFLPLLRRQAQVAVTACGLLMDGGAPARMAEVEAEGDTIRRDLTTALGTTFATPFDRDDIFSLSRQLDDVVDAAQDALLGIAVFGGRENGHVRGMTEALMEGARALRDAVEALPSNAAITPMRKAKHVENAVASLYRYGVDLAIRQCEPAEAMRLTEVLGDLRHLGRELGRAADLLADIVVKEA